MRKLSLAREKSVDGGGELLAALEELQLEQEDEAEQFTTLFLDHFAASPSRAT